MLQAPHVAIFICMHYPFYFSVAVQTNLHWQHLCVSYFVFWPANLLKLTFHHLFFLFGTLSKVIQASSKILQADLKCQ
jgi:hypothetical protein